MGARGAAGGASGVRPSTLVSMLEGLASGLAAREGVRAAGSRRITETVMTPAASVAAVAGIAQCTRGRDLITCAREMFRHTC